MPDSHGRYQAGCGSAPLVLQAILNPATGSPFWDRLYLGSLENPAGFRVNRDPGAPPSDVPLPPRWTRKSQIKMCLSCILLWTWYRHVQCGCGVVVEAGMRFNRCAPCRHCSDGDEMLLSH